MFRPTLSRAILSILLLTACQSPAWQTPPPTGPSTALPQELVPESQGGTLGNQLVPTSNGGTLGSGAVAVPALVPGSNGGTLGKGLVPESRGGTLGRLTLRGQVNAPEGFRLQQANRVYTLQLLDALTQETWLTFDTLPDGSFELQGLPVEKSLILRVHTAASGSEIPLQMLLRFRTEQKNQTLAQTLDLSSTAESLLLEPILRSQAAALPLSAAQRQTPFFQAALTEVAELLASNQFAKHVLELPRLKERQQQVSAWLTSTQPATSSVPEQAVKVESPLANYSFTLGATVPVRVLSQHLPAGTASLSIWGNGQPLQNPQNQPLQAPLSTSELTELLWNTSSLGPGVWQLEIRLLDAQGQTLQVAQGPHIRLENNSGSTGSSGGGSGTVQPPAPAAPVPQILSVQNLTSADLLAIGTPEAYWPAEGSAAESSGLFDGTLPGTVNFAAGIQGQAFAFEGQDGCVEATNLNFARQQYSISLWFKTDTSQPQMLVGEQNSLVTVQMHSNGQLLFTHGGSQTVQSNQAFDDDQWHHLLAVRQSQQLNLYVDGQLEQSLAEPSSDLNSQLTLHLGCGTSSNHQAFKGLIDQVAVYPTALDSLAARVLAGQRLLQVQGTNFGTLISAHQVMLNGFPAEVLSVSPTQLHIQLPPDVAGPAQLQVSHAGSTSPAFALAQTPLRLEEVSPLILANNPLVLNGAGFNTTTSSTVAGFELPSQVLGSTRLQLDTTGVTDMGPLSIDNGYHALTGPNVWLSTIPPVAWWRGEGDTTDTMGNHDGTQVGSITYQKGKQGQAFAFTAGGGYVDLGHLNTFQGEFTLSAWFHPSTIPNNNCLVCGNQSGNPGLQLMLHQTAPHLSFLYRFPAGPSGGVTTTGGALSKSYWHHVVLVKNNLFQILYVDGVSVAEQDNPTVFDSPLQLLLGRLNAADSNGFEGLIDEVMLFDQVLSEGDVNLLYQYGR